MADCADPVRSRTRTPCSNGCSSFLGFTEFGLPALFASQSLASQYCVSLVSASLVGESLRSLCRNPDNAAPGPIRLTRQ